MREATVLIRTDLNATRRKILKSKAIVTILEKMIMNR